MLYKLPVIRRRPDHCWYSNTRQTLITAVFRLDARRSFLSLPELQAPCLPHGSRAIRLRIAASITRSAPHLVSPSPPITPTSPLLLPVIVFYHHRASGASDCSDLRDNKTTRRSLLSVVSTAVGGVRRSIDARCVCAQRRSAHCWRSGAGGLIGAPPRGSTY